MCGVIQYKTGLSVWMSTLVQAYSQIYICTFQDGFMIENKVLNVITEFHVDPVYNLVIGILT